MFVSPTKKKKKNKKVERKESVCDVMCVCVYNEMEEGKRRERKRGSQNFAFFTMGREDGLDRDGEGFRGGLEEVDLLIECLDFHLQVFEFKVSACDLDELLVGDRLQTQELLLPRLQPDHRLWWWSLCRARSLWCIRTSSVMLVLLSIRAVVW